MFHNSGFPRIHNGFSFTDSLFRWILLASLLLVWWWVCDLLVFFFLTEILSVTRKFFLIFSPVHLFSVDGQPRDSQSRLADAPFIAKDGPKEWPQTHPERCHSQCCVWGPGQ